MQPAATPRHLRLAYLLLLTFFALWLHGFHPYAEDGGVYLPGIKRLLNPGLYGPNPAFVLAPMRTSLFAPLVASLVRITHLPLPWMILLLYLLSILLTLWSSAKIAGLVTSSLPGQAAAAALLACWLSLPVAGTSLLLMDPYLTARSLSTPLVLFALGFAMERRWRVTTLLLMAAAALHPLMAGYGMAAVAAIFVCALGSHRHRIVGAITLIIGALTLAGVVSALGGAESPQYQAIVATRYYWFLSQWQWYEVLGLIAPMLLLLGFMRSGTSLAQILARAALLLGGVATLVAICFARAGMSTHLVARLQPLRALQLVYFVMILMLGASLGTHYLKMHLLRWLIFLTLAAWPIGFAARQTYASSDQVEAPWIAPRNAWQQAFIWSRENTPSDALFAIDSFYVTKSRHEDAQTFRAIAERDVLPDYSKDGGEASVAPALTEKWTRGVLAQTGLDHATDAQRLDALRDLHPDWVIFPSEATTAWPCAYQNAVVKVCALPPWRR